MELRASSQAFDRLRGRISTPLRWYPFPAVIAFGLMLVLMAHLVTGVNARLGSPADELVFPSDHSPDGAIWIALSPVKGRIYATTGDRRVMSWQENVTNPADLTAFTDYLKERVAKLAEREGRSMAVQATEASVILAVDQRLSFVHIRPVLYAIAAAHISNYAFETKQPAALAR